MVDATLPRKRLGRFPVWPYYVLSLLGALAGVVLVAVWWPRGYPAESTLVKVSGEIATVIVRDDVSKTRAGAMMPGLTSVYFTLEGVEGEFRYPSTHPQYPIVRDYTAGSIDVWVDGAEIGGGRAATIWRIQEHSNLNFLVPETSISYAEVIDRVRGIDRSMVDFGSWLLAISAALALAGAAVGRWNRGRPPPIP